MRFLLKYSSTRVSLDPMFVGLQANFLAALMLITTISMDAAVAWDPELSNPFQLPEFELMTVPRASEKTGISRQTSVRHLSKAWNFLSEDIRKAQIHLAAEENVALEAILMQIQEGLISIGLVPPPGTQIGSDRRAIQQLVPNVKALRGYLRRKHIEKPAIREFKRLASDANILAEEADRLVPVAPVQVLRQQSPIGF
jgi:hypothetical protein